MKGCSIVAGLWRSVGGCSPWPKNYRRFSVCFTNFCLAFYSFCVFVKDWLYCFCFYSLCRIDLVVTWVLANLLLVLQKNLESVVYNCYITDLCFLYCQNLMVIEQILQVVKYMIVSNVSVVLLLLYFLIFYFMVAYLIEFLILSRDTLKWNGHKRRLQHLLLPSSQRTTKEHINKFLI